LIEIKDPAMIKKIKQNLNIKPSEAKDLAPLICGTLVNGGFKRKLRMLRADLFSGLAVSHSY